MAKKKLRNWLLLNKVLFVSNKKKLAFLFICLFQINLNGQIANYINNGSFEDKINCNLPVYGFKAKYWRGLDSLNTGIIYASTCYSNVPYGGFDFQYPRSGNSYFSFTPLCVPPACSSNNNRAYIKNRLKGLLVNGKTYCVKLYVNITNNSTYGVSNIDLFFGDYNIDTITKAVTPITYIIPQVQNPTGNIITDTLNWIPITGTFVANGTEKYCVIGNFKSDAATTKTLVNPTNLPAVACDILIDDVSCIPIDLPAYAGDVVYT